MRTSILALALLAACATFQGKSNEQKSEAATAQERAQQQFSAAAEAQKNAADEQAKAEEADRNVESAQRALAEARAAARGQHAKARQAQAEARRQGQQASDRGLSAQEEASQFQEKGVQQSQQKIDERQQWTEEQQLEGQVLDAQQDRIRVRSGDKKDLTLNVGDNTSVRVDGRLSSPARIQPGDDVRASYQLVDGKARALEIDVTSNRASGDSLQSPPAGTSGQGDRDQPPPPEEQRPEQPR